MKPWANLLLCSMITMAAACGGEGVGPEAEDLDTQETGVIQKDVPALACAGLLGLACPGEYQCIDDFRDDCDPQNGGADCPGLCVHPKGPVACEAEKPACDAGEICVDNPWLDCVVAPCPTGTCALADFPDD